MYLRVSLTDRCNLRCVYCLPEQARFAPERASGAELRQLMSLICTAVPTTKIRLTGGEPTLVPDLIEHVRHAVGLVDGHVGLTSNGLLLEPLLPALRDAGLAKLNISLDAVDRDAFIRFSRRDGAEAAISAIRAARALGFDPLKVNTVAMADVDFAGLTQFAIDEGLHLRFIELMAIGIAKDWQPNAFIDATAIRGHLFDAGYSLLAREELDEPTARIWAIAGVDPAVTSLGFITTSSAPFCETCDRIRLTSQGRLHNCLFDNVGIDLLAPLRAGNHDGVIAAVRHAVATKAAPEHFVREGNMAAIGG